MNPANFITGPELEEISTLVKAINKWTFEYIGFDVILHDTNGELLGHLTTRDGETSFVATLDAS